MRPLPRRIALASGVVPFAALLATLPAAPAQAVNVGTALTCTASAKIDWSVSGEFSATVTASVFGACSLPGYVTCDIALVGLPGVLARQRTADDKWCSASVTFVGLQNTPYTGVGRVGYSAADIPSAASVTTPVVPKS